MNAELQLTPAEWQLMECLWESAPRTGRECVEYLQRSVGWSRSTTLTMLRRMTEKNMIHCLHQDDKFYLGCIYRKNLEAGRVFYGKNRNVEDKNE